MLSQKELERLYPIIQQTSLAGFSSFAKILKTLNPAPVFPLVSSKANLPQDVIQTFAKTDRFPQHTGITNQTGFFGATHASRVPTGNSSEDALERLQGNHSPGIWSDASPFGDPLGTPPQERTDSRELVVGTTEKNQQERDILKELNVKQNSHQFFAKPNGLNNKALLEKEAALKRLQIEKANQLKGEQQSDNYGVQSPHRAPRQGR